MLFRSAYFRRWAEQHGGTWQPIGRSIDGGSLMRLFDEVMAAAVHVADEVHTRHGGSVRHYLQRVPLPARATPYSRDEVLAAASLHPTIEVVDSRYQDFRSLDRLQVLADNFSNGALVYGAAASGWQGMDLVHPPIAVTADGKPFADCTGLRAGDPIGLFVELVNFVANKRGGVRAGSFVTTGTHTGLVFTEPGVTIRAEYGPLGRVEVSFPP